MTQPAARHILMAGGSAFIDRLREAISIAKVGNPLERVTVVTPGFYSSFYLRRWIARHGLINVEFTRIEDIAELLAQDQVDVRGGRALTRLQGAELVRAAVTETARGGPLDRLAGQPTFLAALQRTLRDLEAEQGEGAVDFSRLQRPDEVTQAVGRAWNVYQRLKSQQNLFDRTQVADWAVEALDSGGLESQKNRLAVGRLVVLAVATPAAQYRKLWRGLVALKDSTVLVGVTGDRNIDTELLEAFGVSEPLQETDSQPGAIPVPQVVSAPDTRSEVASVVSRIAEAAESGVPFNRIAVLFGDSTYAGRVRSALEMVEIPVSGPPPGSLSSAPAGKFINGLLEIAKSDLARQTTGDWLATCAVQHPNSKKPVPGTEWDRISRHARVSGGIGRWRSQLERFKGARRNRAEAIERYGEDKPSSTNDSQVADGLRAEAEETERLLEFVELLANDIDLGVDAEGRSTWSTWSSWLNGVMDRYLLAPENSQAAVSKERVQTLLERIGELDSLPPPRPELGRFASVVSRELSQAQSGQARLGRGVFVGSVRDAVAARFDYVHVLGMTDGTFPSPDTADPLLPDGVREELNNLCGINLAVSGVRLSLRRREFLAALMSGSDVYLYWSRSSGPGSGQSGPAQWLVEQLRRHPDMESLHAGDLLSHPETVPGVSLANYAAGEIVSDINEYEVASVKKHVEAQSEATQHWLESDADSGVPDALALERNRYGKQFTAWSGDLSAVASLLPSVSGEVLSASRVESFATCPLRYFFSYVLKVDPGVREDDSFHMAPDLRGTFIHSLLESYLNLRIADNRPPGEETLDLAVSLTVAETMEKEPDMAGRVWEIETAEIRRQLRRWLAKEAELEAEGYQPAEAEFSFGRAKLPDEELAKYLEVTLPDGEVLQFAGMIDRIDRHSNGNYYVFDYKTGRSESYRNVRQDPVDKGKHLQLALYSRAIEQFKSGGQSPAAAYWFVLDSKQATVPEPGGFDPEEASQRLQDVLVSLQKSSKDGSFPPNPDKRAYNGGGASFENCQYCDFNRVCPATSNRERMWRAHSTDPRLAPYFDLALGRDGGDQ